MTWRCEGACPWLRHRPAPGLSARMGQPCGRVRGGLHDPILPGDGRVMAAGDEAELVHIMTGNRRGRMTTAPSRLRYSRGQRGGRANARALRRFIGNRQGSASWGRRRACFAFLSFGAHLAEVRLAAGIACRAPVITCTIADARFAKPLDHAPDRQLITESRRGCHGRARRPGRLWGRRFCTTPPLPPPANSGQLQSGCRIALQ